jgi:hypothetical protein
MRILLTIPHVFAPQKGSLYSSRSAEKRPLKQQALHKATLSNLWRHSPNCWIHASLGKGKNVVTRELSSAQGVELHIRVFTAADATLSQAVIGQHTHLEVIAVNGSPYSHIPQVASQHALEQAPHFDMVGYMEDDLLIEDSEFFAKVAYLVAQAGPGYAFLPHRCESIPGKGDVILSGDPDGGRPDLFWDTGEELTIAWPVGEPHFYRATNPHSGCYFLTRDQAIAVCSYWQSRNWQAPFQLSGPLEQAASGMLLPVLKVMKPIPSHYRFLMVRHQDELWKRHAFE